MLSIALSMALVAPAHAEETLPAEWLAPVPAAPAVAEDDEEEEDEDSVKSERDAVKSGKATAKKADEPKRKKKIIKTIQPKTFMKLHRYEVGPSLGFVANDPFLNRYILGGVFDYHATEIFAIEAQLAYAPVLGQGGCGDPDWKPLSCQLLEKNSVSPDISRLTAHGSLGLQFSPIYGKVAAGNSIVAFDIYGTVGLGVTATEDDIVALQAEDEPADGDAHRTQNQVHPTTVMGGGARVALSELVAVRAEVKSMTYIETVKSTTLEMKNNLIVQANVSFFFPGMK